MSFRAAFYKGSHGFLNGWMIKWWDHGPYSHCELAFSDGVCGSSVGYEGGVVLRAREMNPEEWDYIDLPDHLEPRAREWFEQHKGKSYDYLGLVRFVFDFLSASRDKWICSGACADALGLEEGWRLGPNGLRAVLKDVLEF